MERKKKAQPVDFKLITRIPAHCSTLITNDNDREPGEK